MDIPDNNRQMGYVFMSSGFNIRRPEVGSAYMVGLPARFPLLERET